MVSPVETYALTAGDSFSRFLISKAQNAAEVKILRTPKAHFPWVLEQSVGLGPLEARLALEETLILAKIRLSIFRMNSCKPFHP